MSKKFKQRCYEFQQENYIRKFIINHQIETHAFLVWNDDIMINKSYLS